MHSFSRLSAVLLSLLFLTLSGLHTTSVKAADLTDKNAALKADIKQADINVVVSIHPLYLAVKEAFADQINTELLLPASVSPHHYSLKPSEILKLRKADLFVWIGPELEYFLIKPVQQKESPHKTVFSVLDWLKKNQADDLLMVNQLRSEDPETQRHQHSHQHNHHHHSGPAKTEDTENKESGLTDPHIWLSRALVISAIGGIQQRLSELRPELASSLQLSSEAFIEDLRQQPATLNFTRKNFISYHNGFDYLAKDAGFSIVDVMTTNTELKPGAHQLASVKKQAENEDICLITEPQFSSGVTAKIAKSSSVAVVEVDPMGSDYKRYSEFYNGTIAKLMQCGTNQ